MPTTGASRPADQPALLRPDCRCSRPVTSEQTIEFTAQFAGAHNCCWECCDGARYERRAAGRFHVEDVHIIWEGGGPEQYSLGFHCWDGVRYEWTKVGYALVSSTGCSFAGQAGRPLGLAVCRWYARSRLGPEWTRSWSLGKMCSSISQVLQYVLRCSIDQLAACCCCGRAGAVKLIMKNPTSARVLGIRSFVWHGRRANITPTDVQASSNYNSESNASNLVSIGAVESQR